MHLRKNTIRLSKIRHGNWFDGLKDGIVRIRHGWCPIGWLEISLAHHHRIYSVALFILSVSLESCTIRDIYIYVLPVPGSTERP